MADLITVTGTVIDHDGGIPLADVPIYVYPSNVLTRTVYGEVAATHARTQTAESGFFSRELVWAPGLRYRIVALVETSRGRTKERQLGVLDCDSWPAGATVDVSDLPPVDAVPASAIDDLRAWILAQQTPSLTVVDGVLYIDEEPP